MCLKHFHRIYSRPESKHWGKSPTDSKHFSDLPIDVTAYWGNKHIGVESCGGLFWVTGVGGVEGGPGHILFLVWACLQESGGGGAQAGRAVLQEPPPVGEGDEQDDTDQHHRGHQAPEDHGEDLVPVLSVLLDLGLGQLLDGLQQGGDGDVERLAHSEPVPDLHRDSVRGAWGGQESVSGN